MVAPGEEPPRLGDLVWLRRPGPHRDPTTLGGLDPRRVALLDHPTAPYGSHLPIAACPTILLEGCVPKVDHRGSDLAARADMRRPVAWIAGRFAGTGELLPADYDLDVIGFFPGLHHFFRVGDRARLVSAGIVGFDDGVMVCGGGEFDLRHPVPVSDFEAKRGLAARKRWWQ